MANRIATGPNGLPALYLDSGGNFTSTAGDANSLANQLVDGSYVYIDGSVPWDRIWIAPRVLGDHNAGVISNRQPRQVTVVAQNDVVKAERFELSGGAEWIMDGMRLDGETTDRGYGNWTFDIDTRHAYVSGYISRMATYTVDGIEYRGMCKKIHVTGATIRGGDFANFLLKSDDLRFFDPTDYMDIRLENVISTDTKDGETFYGGNFQSNTNQHHCLIRVYNCVFARAAAELFQMAHLVGGSEVVNCVMALGALAPVKFQDNQANGLQINHSGGKAVNGKIVDEECIVTVKNTMVLGCEEAILSINHFGGNRGFTRTANDAVIIENCLCGYSKAGTIFIGYAPNTAVPSNTLDYPKTIFRNMSLLSMGQDNRIPHTDKTGEQATSIIRVETSLLRVEAENVKIQTNNTSITSFLHPSNPNHTETNVTYEPVPVPQFVNDGYFSKGLHPFNLAHYDASVTYQPGAYIAGYDYKLYRVDNGFNNQDPATSANTTLITQTTDDNRFPDDFRAVANSTYALANIGLSEGASYSAKLLEAQVVTGGNAQNVSIAKEIGGTGYSIIAYAFDSVGASPVVVEAI